jgi:hypothetical protein
MRRAAVLAAALALAPVATALSGKVIGHGNRLKGTKIFLAQGTAIAPRTISASLAPSPSQAVKVQWSLACQKPNKVDPALKLSPTGTSGQTTVRGAAIVKLKIPFARPPTCVATVYATLARQGDLVLHLVQT